MLNFSISELCHSDIATKEGINNTPSIKVADNLLNLIFYLLQPLRNKLKRAILINSGYRCPKLNSHPSIKGAANSNHLYGYAADIRVVGMSPRDLFNYVVNSGLEYDECILEYNQWVHLAFRKGNNRRKHFEIS